MRHTCSSQLAGLTHLPVALQPKQKREKQTITLQQRLLKEFGCKLCGQVLRMPLTMLCAHTFCKVCAGLCFGPAPQAQLTGFARCRSALRPSLWAPGTLATVQHRLAAACAR